MSQDAMGIDASRSDYGRFLAEYGFEQGAVHATVSNEADQVPMPPGFEHLARRASPIDGEGMFVSKAFAAGTVIAPARLAGKRTPAGRFTNHSPTPNARFEPLANGDLNLVSLRPIGADEEVTIDYRQAARVNGSGATPNVHEATVTAKRRMRARLGW